MGRSASFLQLFLAAVLGALSALLLLKVGASAWRTVALVVVGAAVLWLTLNLVNLVLYWLNGRHGLDQWPHPHGRYYDEWLSLPEGAGDYYEWLSRKMGNREPWSTWASADRASGSR